MTSSTAQHHTATPPALTHYTPSEGMYTSIDIAGWRETIARACDDLYEANQRGDLAAATVIIEQFVMETAP